MSAENRAYDNTKIITLLQRLLKDYPDLRFGQVVANFVLDVEPGTGKITNPFYEEPDVTLKRVQEKMEVMR